MTRQYISRPALAAIRAGLINQGISPIAADQAAATLARVISGSRGHHLPAPDQTIRVPVTPTATASIYYYPHRGWRLAEITAPDSPPTYLARWIVPNPRRRLTLTPLAHGLVSVQLGRTAEVGTLSEDGTLIIDIPDHSDLEDI
ncbi:MAG: hypothetical protein Q4C87_00005 [Actinomycetaceae bacterium]|nr:hypothetical protein [Actinomycetaceae bacterium]